MSRCEFTQETKSVVTEFIKYFLCYFGNVCMEFPCVAVLDACQPIKQAETYQAAAAFITEA